jgi:glutathione S-transferase
MTDPVLRIFSYLPNPRVYKALIAARLGGVEVELVGAKPAQLADWLWDFDARPLPDDRAPLEPFARQSRRGFSGAIYKTDAFLAAHPFGTVPAAFSPDGSTGVFESNSILRAVARAGDPQAQLYGRDLLAASRIDSFLDANLVFAREAQVYLLSVAELTPAVYERMRGAYEFYLEGIERALETHPYLVGDELSIADISFVCDLAQFLREGHYSELLAKAGFSLISADGPRDYPRVYTHLLELSATSAFAAVMGTYLDWYRNAGTGG